MLRVLVFSLLALGLAFGATQRENTAFLAVYMDFDSRPASGTLETMKREVESAMRPAGVKVIWREVKENTGTEAFPGIVKVHFKGSCHVRPWEPADAATGRTATLGTSLVSGGQVLPFSEVRCDAVRRTLPEVEAGTPEQARQGELGRAMGRVVAHELYHVLANTTHHGEEGLAKATQDFSELTGGSLRFAPKEAAEIRQGAGRRGMAFSYK